jgi:hypothetical protein
LRGERGKATWLPLTETSGMIVPQIIIVMGWDGTTSVPAWFGSGGEGISPTLIVF